MIPDRHFAKVTHKNIIFKLPVYVNAWIKCLNPVTEGF